VPSTPSNPILVDQVDDDCAKKRADAQHPINALYMHRRRDFGVLIRRVGMCRQDGSIKESPVCKYELRKGVRLALGQSVEEAHRPERLEVNANSPAMLFLVVNL